MGENEVLEEMEENKSWRKMLAVRNYSGRLYLLILCFLESSRGESA